MDSDPKDTPPALGSFEETSEWQLFEFAKLSIDEKINFLGDMFEIWKGIRENDKN